MEEKKWSEIKEILESYVASIAGSNFKIEELKVTRFVDSKSFGVQSNDSKKSQIPMNCYIDWQTGELIC